MMVTMMCYLFSSAPADGVAGQCAVMMTFTATVLIPAAANATLCSAVKR